MRWLNLDNINEKELLKSLRKKIFITGYKGGMAHLASCYSAIEIIYTLYLRDVLKYDRTNPKWEGRDRFILSKGHAGLALFAVLNQAGLMTDKEFDSYLKPNTRIGGEPCMRDCEWVEATTGSLGHGLSLGLGMALALKTNNSNAKVYVLLGDGECEEGSIWEAAMFASAYKLNNLIAILDHNRIQKMDLTNKIIGQEQWDKKWEAFGWQVKHTDGHDINKLKTIFSEENSSDMPLLIIADTTKGKGISIMENNPNWHFKLPKKKELKVFMDELNVTEDELE